ncbi:hypothetical protein pb186bvf_014468 [Paramecium bursaria]
MNLLIYLKICFSTQINISQGCLSQNTQEISYFDFNIKQIQKNNQLTCLSLQLTSFQQQGGILIYSKIKQYLKFLLLH